MSKTADLMHRAEQLAQTATTWADLSNALFDPLEGLLARAFPTREERQQFIRTAEYQQIQRMLADAVARFGLLEGATPTKITEFMVHLPLTSEDISAAGSRATFGITPSTANPASSPALPRASG